MQNATVGATVGATKGLAKWAAEVPNMWFEGVLNIAQHSLEDTVLAIIAGAGNQGSLALRKVWNCDGGSVPVVGSMKGASAPFAALLNGYAGHAEEVDENFLVGLGHFGTVVVPAVLSVAHEQDLPLSRVLDALIVGSEVMARVGLAVEKPHAVKGWHGTSTCGVIAAAAAVGRLLGLDAHQMTNALSIAVSTAAGPKIQFGTQAKPFHPGWAAFSGIIAARTAQGGLGASSEAFEGKTGFGHLYAGDKPADWSKAVPKLGDRLAIETYGLAFKKHANCASTHRAIEALLKLKATHGFAADDVEKIEALVGEINIVNLPYMDPQNPKQAQFSMPYALATVLRFGSVTLADFVPQAVHDPETRKLAKRVEMRLNPDHANMGDTAVKAAPHRVIVTLKNGNRFQTEVVDLKGSLKDPLTMQERREKFNQCTDGILPIAAAELLRDALANPLTETRYLMALLQFEAKVDDGSRFRR